MNNPDPNCFICSHAGLTRDERLVYNCIENAGNAGIWNKTIKNRIAAHAQIMERVIKSLTNKGLIKSMTTVKHPGRKMYIVSNLLPNEEATGGAWFSGSDLDTPLLNGIAAVVHLYIAEQSWQEVDPIDHVSSPSNKRKAPADGFDDEGDSRSKAPRIDDSPNHKKKHSSKSSARARSYRPFDASYQKYPTLPDICSAILKSKVTGVVLPQNAIAQLLEVMFYDEKLYKVTRKATGMEDEDPDNVADIVMWRSYKTPAAVAHEMELTKRKLTDTGDSRRTALRQLELEEVGRGGATEVPCMKCPVFDICGDGGPISARTCKYFDEWYLKLADADREAGVGVYAPMGKGKEKAKDKDKGKEKAVFDVEFEVSQEGDDEMQDS